MMVHVRGWWCWWSQARRAQLEREVFTASPMARRTNRPVGLSCAGASPKQKKKWRSDEALPRQQLDCAQHVRQPIVATVNLKRHWHHT